MEEDEQQYLGHAGGSQGGGRGKKGQPPAGQEQEAARRGRGRGAGARKGKEKRDEGGGGGDETYFDWDNDDIFLPGLHEVAADGRSMTDKIQQEDDILMRINKLLWRRQSIQSKDMDQHVPKAWRPSKAVYESIALTEEQLAEGSSESEDGEEASYDVNGKEEMKRLNAAKTVSKVMMMAASRGRIG